MAGFAGAPRLWSRNNFVIEYGQYLFDNTYKQTFSGHVFGAAVFIPKFDFSRVAFNVASDPVGSPGTQDGGRRINAVYARHFEINTPQYGVTSTAGIYTSATSVGPAGGLVPATTGPAPLWGAFDYTTPNSYQIMRWTGAYSEDGTIFCSFMKRKTDGVCFLSVSSGGTTLVDKSSLSIKHTDYTLYTGARYRTDVRIFVFSTTNIWILHIAETSSGAGDKGLFLSVWNGTTISSTTRLGTFQTMDFEAVRQPGLGQVLLMYRSPSSDYNTYVRTINEGTRALSAVLLTDDQTALRDVSFDWRPGGRMPLNKVLVYKGYHYVVHAWHDRIVCYRYAAASPNTIVKRFEGIPDFRFGFQATYNLANTLAIEYDPVSDTAMLCWMDVYAESGGSGVETRDTRVMHMRRSHCALDAASWGMTVTQVEQTEDYVFQPGSDSAYISEFEVYGYIPSWTGVSAVSLILIQLKTNTMSTLELRTEILRFANWRNPVEVSSSIVIANPPTVNVSGVRDYEVAITVPNGVEIDFKGYRARQIAFKNSWTSVADTSVNGEVHIVIEPAVSITGALAENHSAEVHIEIAPTVFIQGDTSRVFEFRHGWISMGRTFVEEFHEYLNEERATVWGLPPVKIAGTNDLSLDALKTMDVAQRHSDDMANTRLYDHDSLLYPPGWEYASDRIGYVGFVGAENIMSIAAYFERGDYPPPTAFEVWDAWKHSPPHYANAMTDWSVAGDRYNDLMFSMLAVTMGQAHIAGGYPNGTGPAVDPPDAQDFYFTNVFVSIEETLVDVQLTIRWQTDALEVSMLQHSWQSAALFHVRGQVVFPYSLPLQGAFVAPYSVAGVSGSHEQWSTHSVGGSVELSWAGTQRVGPFAHLGSYDLEPRSVRGSMELVWSRTLAGEMLAPYDDTRRVRGSTSMPYSELFKTQGGVVMPYGTPTPVHGSFEGLYALRTAVRGQFVITAFMGPRVVGQTEAPYALQDLNPVNGSVSMLWDLRDNQGAVFTSLGATVTLNGRTMPLSDGYVTCDYDAPGYTFECQVPDLEFIRGAKVGDRLDVNFAGTQYVLFLSNLSDNSAERSAAPEVTLSGMSPIYMLDVPYAEMETFAPDSAMLFSALIEEVLGVSVDFSRHIDWLVPFGRAQGAAQTPLAFAKGLLESVGSCLLSNPDGSVYALARFPHGLNALPDGAVDHVLSEHDKVFTRGSSYQYAKGYNRYRVRDSEASFADQIEYEEDDDRIYVHISPYRHSWELRCTTTPLILNNHGEETVEKEEMWDFKTGTVSAGYPILDLVSVTWLSDTLGGLSFEPHSTKVTAPVTVNLGYGLAKVVYRTKRTVFELVSSTKLKAAQLIIVEK